MPALPPGRKEPSGIQPTATRVVRVVNTDDDDVPPFGAMEVTGYDPFRQAFKVGRCTVTGRNDLLFNGITPIPSNMEGQARSDIHVTAGFIPSEGLHPHAGELWGVPAGEWFLKPNYTGYVVVDTTTAARGFCVVQTQRHNLTEFVRITDVASVFSGDAPATYYAAALVQLDPTADTWTVTTMDVWFRETSGRTIDPSEYASPLDIPAIRIGYSFGRPLYVGRVPAPASAATDSAWKTPVCRAGTLAALPSCTYGNGVSGVGATLTGNSNGALTAQDGVTLTVNQSLLVKNQSNQTHNGIYTLTQVGSAGTPFILTRRTDNDTSAKMLGATVTVSEGTQADTVWLCTANATISIGGTSLPWVKTNVPGDVVGPSSATDNAVARYDGTTGKLIQDSQVIIADTGDVTGLGTLNTRTIANWVDGPASAVENSIPLFAGTTGKGIKASVGPITQELFYGDVTFPRATQSQLGVVGIPLGGTLTTGNGQGIMYSNALLFFNAADTYNRSSGFVSREDTGPSAGPTEIELWVKVYLLGGKTEPGSRLILSADKYSIRTSDGPFGTLYDGVTGTLEIGATVVGGIITGVGTGGTPASLTDLSDAIDDLTDDLTTLYQPLNGELTSISAGTWVGATSITTLGTIGSGTWNGTVVDIPYGGTNANNAADARTNLGLAIGVDVQAWSSTLDSVTSGTYGGSSSITTVGTIGSGTWQGTTVAVAYGGTGATDASGARTNLGIVIGTDIQAWSATLDAVAAGTYTGSASITTLGTIGTGTWNGSVIDIAYGGTNANNAPDARTNLGLAIGSNVQAWSGRLDALAAGSATGVLNINDATGGTSGTGTINDVTIFHDQTILNNNFAEIAAKLNEIMTALRTANVIN